MKLRIASAAIVAWLGVCSVGFAWGPEGHKIVATIAEQRLTPAARLAVQDLLGKESMADVATWPDQVRREPKYTWTNFHGVMLAPGAKSFVYSRDCGKGCVVKMLNISVQTLENPQAPRQERYEALKCIIHFVGDVHQPVHAERAGEKNGIKVDFFGREVGLHAVWDGLILLRTQKPWEKYARDLNASITPKQAAQWSADTDFSDWATESWQIVSKYVRDLPADNKITAEYCRRSLPLLEQRLEMGGVRLAATLNTIFAKEAKPAVPAAKAK